MNIGEALEIVCELADASVASLEEHLFSNPDLQEHVDRQNEALNIVHDLLVKMNKDNTN